MTNENIRKAARVANIPLWRIADAMGVGENTVYRWLRRPLDEEKEQRFMDAIEQLSKEEA